MARVLRKFEEHRQRRLRISSLSRHPIAAHTRVAARKNLRSPNAGERTDELLGKNSPAGPAGLIRAPAGNRARGIDRIVGHVREEEVQ